MKNLYIFSCKLFNIINNHRHVQVLMDVIISYIPQFINNTAAHVILCCLKYFDVGFLYATKKLNKINPQQLQNLIVE